MRSVLITGSNGFIGRNLVKRLAFLGIPCIELNSSIGDVAIPETWENLPASSVVVHLAAKTFVPASWGKPSSYMATNCMGTSNALEYCRRHQAKLVFLSSYMYGDPTSLPIPEDAPLQAKNPYALSKILAEQICNFYREHYEIDICVLRVFNVYGSGQNDSFLVQTIFNQALEKKKIQVLDLRPRRDYVYIKDVVEAIICAINYRGDINTFNIGSGISYSVEELIAKIQLSLGTSLEVVSENNQRPGEIMETIADIGLANRHLNWRPHFSLDDGLLDMTREL